ncbi:hypothetical protein [Parvularcula sp. LCG005]|uniref:hypothetical protein n=1 Tax=Parvularcula sp. LCG005 TaxID=3078805 RepID=UPI0029427068|nr:hypothetical protein [Parvularcula sp. LCG005]WOI54690.1 hypothetical protein RUI03_06725 [Parvularcula sp. LCG005]
MIQSILLSMALVAAAPEAADDVKDDAVVCFEHDGSTDEAVWISVAERYFSGAKKWREVVLEPGKKTCIRYDNLRFVIPQPYTMSEIERRQAEKDQISPWRPGVCGRLSKNSANYLKLSVNPDGEMSCTADNGRSDEDIRGLVSSSNPITG